MQNKAVLLDRDGTLNIDKNYLYRIEDLEWMPEAREALAYLHRKGYLAIVVTNQSGIARGYYTVDDMQRLHDFMTAEIAAAGGKIEKFYYCPHHVEGKLPEYTKKCECRKPAPGMLLQAVEDFDLNKAKSFVVGDSPRDVEAAANAGLRGFLYGGGSLLDFLRGIIEKEAE